MAQTRQMRTIQRLGVVTVRRRYAAYSEIYLSSVRGSVALESGGAGCCGPNGPKMISRLFSFHSPGFQQLAKL